MYAYLKVNITFAQPDCHNQMFKKIFEMLCKTDVLTLFRVAPFGINRKGAFTHAVSTF